MGRALNQWDSWFEPAVCHYFSSNNVRFLAYVFTGGDPQLEWLKHNKSNRVYLFETIFLSLVYLYNDIRIVKSQWQGVTIVNYDTTTKRLLKLNWTNKKYYSLAKTGYRLGVCHGWFHLYMADSSCEPREESENDNEKFVSTAGLEHTISRLLDWHSN